MGTHTPGSFERSDLLTRPWTPFILCQPDARKPDTAIYLNSRYQVHLRRLTPQEEDKPDLVHLSFKKRDQSILVPYEDKLRIKDELVHPECEGVELPPARTREVDLSNQYHLWVVDSIRFRFSLSTHMFIQAVASPDPIKTEELLKRSWTPLLPVEGWKGAWCIAIADIRCISNGSRPKITVQTRSTSS